MYRIACFMPLLALLFAGSVAAGDAVMVDGEPFTKMFAANAPNGERLIEFVRETESFEKWTKLVGYRYQQMPGAGNDPRKVATAMAQIVKSANPQSQSRVIVNEKADEALIDFLTWPPDVSFMEFNIFRFARSADGKAVISLQLAYRFADATKQGLENFRKVRDSWVNQAAAFDMKRIDAAFAQP